MKRSNYNLFFQKNNCVLSYNTITDSYVVVSKESYKSFINSELSIFKKKFPSVFKSFLESGFIIDDITDELGGIRFAHKKQTMISRDYFLMVYPTQDCNLNCWYCYESHVEGSCMSEDIVQSIVRHVENKINRREIDSLHITFFGGEPLLFFEQNVYPLLKQVKELCDEAGIVLSTFFITNGSLIDKDMVMKLKLFNPMFQITLDGNKKKHNKVRKGKNSDYPTFDKIITALNLISENRSTIDSYVSRIITVRINYDNQTLNGIDEIVKNIDNLDREKVTIHLERVWQTKHTVDKKQIEQLKQVISKFAQAGFKVGQGIFGRRAYSCPAEVYDYAIINYNGLVYRCNGRNLTPETAEGKLLSNGNIEWDEHSLIKRLSRPTYDNEECLKCSMLPQCMGPCSQKQLEKGWGNIEEVCSLNAIDVPLEDYLTLDFEVRHLLQNKYKS